jgi:hypothetical protein
MKKLTFTLILSIVVSFHANSQTIYLADTGFATDVGYGGAEASCKTNGMVYNSESMDRTHGIWDADVFTVPTGATWVFDTVIVYGYQTGSGLTSPFTACNLQIFNGTPGAGGSVVWGDTSTNFLNSTAFTGIYKVDTISASGGLMETNRPIMYLKLYLATAPVLHPGTYWLAWSATSSSGSGSASTPYKVLPGRINPVGQQSRMLYGGSWDYNIDNGDTVGLNMMIIGRAGLGVELTKNNSVNILSQNVPNPFSNTTVISYRLAGSGGVKLCVYNVLGQLIATLADDFESKGEHQVTFNAGGLPNGIYYYRLLATDGTVSRQMVLKK